ncbi:MAG: hypothetical protein ACKN9T_09900 [Candidatus Methylumidiphilus sp.]
MLPYHLFNYAAACKPCNSTLKKDYFPIAGKYQLDADDPASLADEQAYLLYPIGDIDADPEELIAFHGASPYPLAAAGHSRNRALVTIEFFQLDNPLKRKNLFRDRALIIMAIYPFLQQTQEGTVAEMADARSRVQALLNQRLPHLNCAKSFVRLFAAQPDTAKQLYDNACNLLTASS